MRSPRVQLPRTVSIESHKKIRFSESKENSPDAESIKDKEKGSITFVIPPDSPSTKEKSNFPKIKRNSLPNVNNELPIISAQTLTLEQAYSGNNSVSASHNLLIRDASSLSSGGYSFDDGTGGHSRKTSITEVGPSRSPSLPVPSEWRKFAELSSPTETLTIPSSNPNSSHRKSPTGSISGGTDNSKWRPQNLVTKGLRGCVSGDSDSNLNKNKDLVPIKHISNNENNSSNSNEYEESSPLLTSVTNYNVINEMHKITDKETPV